MRELKKTISLFLIVIMCLAAVSCGEKTVTESSSIITSEVQTSSKVNSQSTQTSSETKNETSSQAGVSSVSQSSQISSTTKPLPQGLSMSGVIPKNCSYKTAEGKLYPAGAAMPSEVRDGDVFSDGVYEYKYNYVCEEGEESGWIKIEKYATGWGVRVLDKTASSYPEMYSSINSKPVTNIYQTFTECHNLKATPKLSQNAVNLNFAFFNCSSLESITMLPTSTITMNSTFGFCEKLKAAPDIPSKVRVLSCTFMSCTSLEKAGVIPASVTDLGATFQDCTSLTGEIIFNTNADYCDNLFEGTKQTITITGNSDNLFVYMRKSSAGNIEVSFKELF